MGLISGVCMQCGGKIEFDDSMKKGYCVHCRTQFIKDDIININNTTQRIVKNVYGREKTETEEYIVNGDVFIFLGNYELAREQYELAIKSNPANCFGWFGIVKYYTKNFTDYLDEKHLEFLEKARRVASNDQLKIIEQDYKNFERKQIQTQEIVKFSYVLEKKGYKFIAYEQIVNTKHAYQTWAYRISQSFPKCPFCEKDDNYEMWHGKFPSNRIICGRCHAEIEVTFALFSNKIKRIKIINPGKVNHKKLKKGKINSKELI